MRTRTASSEVDISKLEFHPLKPERWADFEKLFSPTGTWSVGRGCWCMWWLLSHREYEASKGKKTKKMMKDRVDSGEATGLLAYLDGQPIGWCSFGPRETFSRLQAPPFKKVLARLDDTPIWSIVCFYVAPQFRRQGLNERLLKAGLEYLRGVGVEAVEGYPIDPRSNRYDKAFTGIPSTFRKAGFSEAARRSERRPIMRYSFEEQQT